MKIFGIAALILAWSGAAQGSAAERVEPIARDWKASDLRRLGIASVSASTSLGGGGQYLPARAVDGHRGTKWVATDRPSRERPQWIRLDLFGLQHVVAVAVFGEEIGNDGIQDAQVQVAGSRAGEFSTVAEVRGAGSASWLATFDPVKTSAVRLLVTRSGGPSTHTDVFEVEVYGTPLSPAELKAYAAERLAGAEGRWKGFLAEADKLGLKADAPWIDLRKASAAIGEQIRQLSERLSRWESLGAVDRQDLVVRLERLEARAQRAILGLSRAAAVGPGRARDIAAARDAARQAAPDGNVAWTREGDTVRISNDRVSVVLDESGGNWDATWLGGVDAAVRRVRFGLEVDRRDIALPAARAEAAPFSDPSGSGLELRQRWGKGVEVERSIRLYRGKPAVVVSARCINASERDVALGSAHLLDLPDGNGGWWLLGGTMRAPAAVGFPDASPPCRPAPDEELADGTDVQYGSSAVLALAPPDGPGGLVLGFLSSEEGAPSVAARFRTCEGGTALQAMISWRGRVLKAGEAFALDPVWLSVEESPHGALESFGVAAAALSPRPVRTGANALWCSWYPLRMTIDEEIVLAHAEIAARHFKPLGLDVIQLDHGWQRGNICGDWVPNERFPHGLAWLSEELRSRHGMKLGLWIAPTQVAFTSQLFRDHPEWMARGPDGKPAPRGRWFWAPNPEMAVLDAAQPAAEKWIEETFARLSAEGAGYYKIDFIAGSPSLRRAMEAIRRGAGPDAWIRYCQTPPLLSAGLANSSYIGDDTGDAGLAGWLELERRNAPLLAASYWANDRLYHREVCDMSVGMKAGDEEARFKLTLMTLAGCSISFSDDFRPLTPPRIRSMQQCLPPGNPPARPLDLFERELPSLWHMRCGRGAGAWDAVGVFNFEDEPRERTVELAALGLPAGAEVVAFEFWEGKPLGRRKDRVAIPLAPGTARVILIHRLPARPQVIATDLHVLGGHHEIERQIWDEGKLLLTGRYRRAPGLEGKAFLYVPAGYRPRPVMPDAPAAGGLKRWGPAEENLWVQEVRFQGATVEWAIPFERASP